MMMEIEDLKEKKLALILKIDAAYGSTFWL